MTEMTNVQLPRGRFLRFLTTIPGILTAVAALITAVTGIYVGGHHDGSSPGPVNLIMSSPSAPPPSVTSVDPDSLQLSRASADLDDLGNSNPVVDLVSQCAAGDDGACASILDILAQECADGAGVSCDVLYELSPDGSDYNVFGATCGGRWLNEDYADLCGEQ